jgi:lysyl-tRNA synthetase class 2
VGDTTVTYGGRTVSVRAPYRRLLLREAAAAAASERLGEPVSPADLRDRVRAAGIARRLGLEVDGGAAPGEIAMEMFEHLCEEQLVEPTFVYDFPTEVSPLSKQRADDPDTVERFELYVAGFEVANAFSELNDPDEQRLRFEQQQRLHAAGDEEAQPFDEDFLRALEQGMPPTGGLGLGVDRLLMILSGRRSIREVVLFPALRDR